MPTLVSESSDVAPPAPRPVAFDGRTVHRAALALVALSVLVRGWLVAGRDYYADDFRMLHLADTSTLLSPSYLGYNYDGQFVPGLLLVVGLVERVAPLQWWLAAATLIVLQLLASLALLRLLRVLLGDRPLLLVPLVFGLFSPITLGSFAWWAAALNSLPLQIGFAWVTTEAVLLVRSGRSRHAVRGTVGVAVALLFYVKAVLVPPLAFAIVALVLLRDGERSWIGGAWRRGRALWLGSLAVMAVWAVAFLWSRSRSEASVRADDNAEMLETLLTGLEALVVGVFGGPFGWVLFPPGAPIADSPAWLVGLSVLVLLAACVWTCRLRRGAGVVWAVVVVTTVTGLLLAAAGRAVLGLGEVLPLAFRYFSVEAVLLPVAGALLATLPSRGGRATAQRSVTARPGPLARTGERVRTTLLGSTAALARTAGFARVAGRPGTVTVPVTTALTAVFTVLSLASTAGHAQAWESDRAGAYLSAATETLAAAGPAPLLDQEMPPDVMWRLFYPFNKVSRTLSPLEDRPPFADSTTELRALDDTGHLRPAEVRPIARLAAGKDPDCGWLVDGGSGTVIGLTETLIRWEWTARLDYSAYEDTTITVALGSGEAVTLDLRAGAGTVYVRLVGGGQELRVAEVTPGVTCVRGGVVGGVTVG